MCTVSKVGLKFTVLAIIATLCVVSNWDKSGTISSASLCTTSQSATDSRLTATRSFSKEKAGFACSGEVRLLRARLIIVIDKIFT